MNRVIGILGGMGPQATVDAMNKIIKHTSANRDQDHIPVITVSIPDIPDRTESINNKSDDSFEKMAKYLKILENANVGCIIIPCNTAHYWFDRLQQTSTTTMLSIIDSSVSYIKNNNISEVCILATSATINTYLYQTKLDQQKVKYTLPSERLQQQIMNSIYLYKSGKITESKKIMHEIISLYTKQSNMNFLLACTEIPLILEEYIQIKPTQFIDATDVLVKNAIHWYHSGSMQ